MVFLLPLQILWSYISAVGVREVTTRATLGEKAPDESCKRLTVGLRHSSGGHAQKSLGVQIKQSMANSEHPGPRQRDRLSAGGVYNSGEDEDRKWRAMMDRCDYIIKRKGVYIETCKRKANHTIFLDGFRHRFCGQHYHRERDRHRRIAEELMASHKMES